jgi:hypothetical protein
MTTVASRKQLSSFELMLRDASPYNLNTDLRHEQTGSADRPAAPVDAHRAALHININRLSVRSDPARERNKRIATD